MKLAVDIWEVRVKGSPSANPSVLLATAPEGKTPY